MAGLRRRAWIAAIVAAWAVLYFRQLFLGKMSVFRDQLIDTWPSRKVLADALHHARLPEWNDLIGFGTQFAGSAANGATYPPLWLTGVLPLPFSLDLIAALHVLLAGIGVAFFARRLGAKGFGAALAGASFMTCGYVTSIATNKVFAGVAWVPWVAWASDRVADPEAPEGRLRGTIILAAIVAAQLLAGDPATCIDAGLTGLIVLLARARDRAASMASFAAAYCTAVVLAAAGLLPGLKLLPQTTRGALSFAEASTWSLHPWRLLEVVWPGALGDPLDASRNLAELVANSGGGKLSPSFSISLYLGAPIVALALLAARGRHRGMLAGAVALTVLALGAYTPIYPLFRAVFPPEQVLRYPEKHIVGAICLLCSLAGAGVAEVLNAPRRARWIFTGAAAFLAVPLAALALLRPWFLHRLGSGAALLSPPLELEQILAGSLRTGALSLLAAAAVSWLLLRLRPGGALAVYLTHAIWAAWQITPLGSAERFARLPQLLRAPLAASQGAGPPRRVLRSSLVDAELLPETLADAWHETLYLNSPGRFGVDAVPGFEAWRSKEFASLWRRAGALPVTAFATLFAVDFVALPAAARQSLGSLFELETGSAAGSADGKTAWTLARIAGVRPRAFVAPRWRWTPQAAAVDALLEPARARDPGLVVLSGAGDAGGGTEQLIPCRIAAYQPERVSMLCDSPSGGYAVLADEYAAGWTAAVDGEAAAISRADVLLRAVRIGAGSHRVDFIYRTPLLRTGIAISCFAWLAWAALLLRTGRRRETAPAQRNSRHRSDSTRPAPSSRLA